MPDRTEPNNWPSSRGPWPEVTDVPRLYDLGAPWCLEARAHPDPDGGGYPEVRRHARDECASRPIHVGDARRGVLGPIGALAVYAVMPFQFGTRRDDAVNVAVTRDAGGRRGPGQTPFNGSASRSARPWFSLGRSVASSTRSLDRADEAWATAHIETS